MLEAHCSKVLEIHWGSSCTHFLTCSSQSLFPGIVALFLVAPKKSRLQQLDQIPMVPWTGWLLCQWGGGSPQSQLTHCCFLSLLLMSPVVVVMLVSDPGCPEELGHHWGRAGKDHTNSWGGTTGDGRKLHHVDGLKNAPWGVVILAGPLGASKPSPPLFEPLWERWEASSLASYCNVAAFFDGSTRRLSTFLSTSLSGLWTWFSTYFKINLLAHTCRATNCCAADATCPDYL